MPIGIERINARHVQSNSRIVFIKPLPGPTEASAQDFLERVAAICHPIMKSNHLSVMSLEEYEPNPEFIGRNFNAGEVIQLVLKAPYTGHWLNFRSVVMVMMHELAHCNEMNHSRAFWAKRNQFATEMKELWRRGYTGDGFWGKGTTLLTGQYEPVGSLNSEVLPRSLCGGTFRSSGGKKRKRKTEKAERKSRVSYAERQQRRIAKRFGTQGLTLGDDQVARVKLEDGKKAKGKPRVAGSARGRELRAAAALARFNGHEQVEPVKGQVCVKSESESDTESDYEGLSPRGEPATDLNGTKLFDSKGNGMIKVCEDEDGDNIYVKKEMEELNDINKIPSEHQILKSDASRVSKSNLTVTNRDISKTEELMANETRNETNSLCPICTMVNPSSTILCTACSHVLSPSKMPDHWQCQSEACRLSSYVNPGDHGLCGVCGKRRTPG